MFLELKESRWSSGVWFRSSFPAVLPGVAETMDPFKNKEGKEFKEKNRQYKMQQYISSWI